MAITALTDDDSFLDGGSQPSREMLLSISSLDILNVNQLVESLGFFHLFVQFCQGSSLQFDSPSAHGFDLGAQPVVWRLVLVQLLPLLVPVSVLVFPLCWASWFHGPFLLVCLSYTILSPMLCFSWCSSVWFVYILCGLLSADFGCFAASSSVFAGFGSHLIDYSCFLWAVVDPTPPVGPVSLGCFISGLLDFFLCCWIQ
ncbi:Hypothetical predicted protein [Olea europaea subsp. europaea]|uniref:Uncharacterized protein n=1 Tax=Olea europaea subsp. europaea TaxID=158383 RepID=A0A8S0UWI4_OLEEU|nr:Hypothetical predicted protein [Olea europaea subsp. europaea]